MIILTRAMGKGWYFSKKNKTLVFSAAQQRRDQDLKPSEKTISVMEDIANSINGNIQVTSDSPETNSDGKMPVLDLKI